MATIQSLLDKHHNHTLISRTESFEYIKHLASKLGISHKSMGKVIHLAGTNGKGSTQHMLWSLLKASGKSCHLLTSPHIQNINERIILNNHDISDEQLLLALKTIDTVADRPISYFALLMLAALSLFSQVPADYTLLEAGVGGEFDTTNCLDDHAMSILTPIGLDHCNLLGNTLEKIALTKACIQRPNRPCIVAPQKKEALDAIKAKSNYIGSQLHLIDDHNFSAFSNYFKLDQQHYTKPSLEGDFQMKNAAVAMKAYLTIIDDASCLTTDAINNILQNLMFPGRLHPMPEGKITKQLQHSLWIDGAHNPHAAQALIPFLKNQQQPIYLWCRFKANKDFKTFLSLLQPWVSLLVYQADQTPGVADKHTVTTQISDLNFPIRIAHTYQEAVNYFNQLPQGLVLACGSLHWVGDLLNANKP